MQRFILVPAMLAVPATAAQAGTGAFLTDWHAALIGLIADPNVAFILLLIGIYGLLLEVVHPGAVIPAVTGIVCLTLASLALSALPVQYGALALLFVGIALMIGEIFTPGFGAVGAAGFLAFVVGAYFLFGADSSGADIQISLPVIAGSALASAALTFFVAGAAIKVRRQRARTGSEQMQDARGLVVDWQDGRGHIRTHGEIWAARADQPVKAGDNVRVTRRDGLTLFVEID